MSALKLFSPAALGSIKLVNRVVMAPMTRNRADANHVPTDLVATYYAERSGPNGAGLIITEGTGPTPEGNGYTRMPGAHNEAQFAAWKRIADAVHEKEGKIFVQLMHTGRISHPVNFSEPGCEVVAPSAVAAAGQIYTDAQGMQDHPVPRELTTEEVEKLVKGFVESAKNLVEKSGVDGVEIHAANGYLVEQFLRPTTNQRTDKYGGSPENRNRFAIEIAEGMAAAIGVDRVGIRISPYGVFNDMPYDAALDSQYVSLVTELNGKVGYVHIVDHSSQGAPAVAQSLKDSIRKAFKGTYILSGGYVDAASAEADIDAGKGDLVAFGRPFLANPDLAYRLKHKKELAQPDFTLLYTPGEKGYLGYPALEHTEA